MKYSAWDQAMQNTQKRMAGKIAVKMTLVNDFYPMTHKDFVIRRAPGYDHIYHVVRNDNGRWGQYAYEDGKIEFRCGDLHC
jgi:hypothetical protein